MTLDISRTLEPRSDQVNSDDLIAGSRVVTITDITKGTAEQPVCVVTAEFGTGRPYKPSKSMRRVLALAWGVDAAAWIGRQLEIYRDPDITFGREKVGGIRISRLSHIDRPLDVPLTVSKGRRTTFTVQPLKAADHA